MPRKSSEEVGKAVLLVGEERAAAEGVIAKEHYTHSIPSGKSYYYRFGDPSCLDWVIIVFSIPANKNLKKYLIESEAGSVWELSRLWAPNGHRKNLLTQAISSAVQRFLKDEPSCVALVSYADPNVGHTGGIYKAASWHFCGQCEESRYYKDSKGNCVSRRSFHSGKRGLKKAEIEAKGYTQLKLPGKLRFAFGLNKKIKKKISERFK